MNAFKTVINHIKQLIFEYFIHIHINPNCNYANVDKLLSKPRQGSVQKYSPCHKTLESRKELDQSSLGGGINVAHCIKHHNYSCVRN